MNKLLMIAVLAALGGCAATPDSRYGYQQPGYGQGGYGQGGYGAPGDPSEWRVVSVTPVPRGTGERVAREGGSTVEYSSVPVQPAPVYAPQPVYVPEPAYVYPPVTFSLGLMLGRSWGGHRHHHHHRGHRRHR